LRRRRRHFEARPGGAHIGACAGRQLPAGWLIAFDELGDLAVIDTEYVMQQEGGALQRESRSKASMRPTERSWHIRSRFRPTVPPLQYRLRQPRAI